MFAEAAKRKDIWKKALEGWNVIESEVVNEWIAEGRVKGKAEGKAEGVAASVLMVLEEKFGIVPEEVITAVRSCADTTKLRQWLGAAVRAESIEAFRATVGT